MPAPRLDGATRMRALVQEVPEHLRAGYRLGREVRGVPAPLARAHIVGMGGSAIAADLALGLTEAETDLALSISRGPALPRPLPSDTWVILASYSGETWETVSAYDAARRRGLGRVVISSGGTLVDRALADGMPVLPLPSGIPQRAAVGFLFGGLLGLIDSAFPESNEARIDRATAAVGRLLKAWAGAEGAPARVAAALDGRDPFVYADVPFAGLARRWATQLQENAKILAQFDLLPELFHNAIEGWTALSAEQAARTGVVTLEWSEQSPQLRWCFDYLDRLLRQRAVAVERVALKSEDRLEALLQGIGFGDLVSIDLAERRGVDPITVPAIEAFKAARTEGPFGTGARPPAERGRPPGARRAGR